MSAAARCRLLGALLILACSSCQALLGDFAVDDSPAAPPLVLHDFCTPNTYICDGADLKTCAADRNSWKVVATCASADECDPSAGACRTCMEPEVACNGAFPQTCAAGHWTARTMPCDSAELCEVVATRTSVHCRKAVCPVAGAHQCDGNRLSRCSSGLDRLELVEICGSPALCDAAKADTQAAATGHASCVPSACVPGTFACEGSALERCRDDLSGWDAVQTCADATSCNPALGACVPCTPGDLTCSGATLLACGTGGFTPSTTCSAPALCDPTTLQCAPTDCSTPGAVRCVNGDLTELQVCGSDGKWVLREPCESGALCSESAGRCLPAACSQGAARCLEQAHQICSDDLTRWVTDKTCSDHQTCTPDKGCQSAACDAGTYRCNFLTLELCTSQGWEPQARCLTADLCSASAPGCADPKCGGDFGDFLCDGRNVKQCESGRTGWEDFFQCEEGTTCMLENDKPICVATQMP